MIFFAYHKKIISAAYNAKKFFGGDILEDELENKKEEFNFKN